MAQVTRTNESTRDTAAYAVAILALIASIVAWGIAANAGNKVSQAITTANHALDVSRDAQSNANKAVRAANNNTGGTATAPTTVPNANE